jgi:hypothetical protein
MLLIIFSMWRAFWLQSRKTSRVLLLLRRGRRAPWRKLEGAECPLPEDRPRTQDAVRGVPGPVGMSPPMHC